MPPKKINLPKSAAPKTASKPAAPAAKATTPTTTIAKSTTKLSDDAKKSLVTQHTSPAIVRKAFQKMTKLFEALIEDMDQPLPPKVAKTAKILDAAGFESLSKRLHHIVTRYVLFVCQEGTITTIESQSQSLLHIVREVCLSLRVLLNQSGPTLQSIIVETGCGILEGINSLLTDLSNQVNIEWKRCIDTKGNFKSPLEGNDGSQIVTVTARCWKACETLANIPLTDKEAIILRAQGALSIIKDAHGELKQVKMGEYDLPLVEGIENLTETTKSTQSDPAPELSSTESPEISKDLVQDAKTDERMEEFDDAHQDTLSKSEFQWTKNGVDLLDHAVSLISTLLTKIIPAMTHPNTLNGTTQIDLKVPGAIAKQKAFAASLEYRLHDIEAIGEYVDMMSECLYTPQNIPVAAKYAWCIFSKLTRMLIWCDFYQSEGWLSEVVNKDAFSPLYTLDKDYKDLEKSNLSPKELEKVYTTYANWYIDPLINPQFRPKVTGTDSEYIAALKPTSDQYKTLHEFDSYKLPPLSQWFFINFQRKMMFNMIYAKNTTTLLETGAKNEIIVNQIEEDGEETVASYPCTNLILQHFVFNQYNYVMDPSSLGFEQDQVSSGLEKPHEYTEMDLLDDIEIMDLEECDEDEDEDEDDDEFNIYVFDE